MQGIASTGVTLSRPNGNNDLAITDLATGETVTVRGEFSPWGSGVLQAITFDDGVTWSATQLRQMLLSQESAAVGGSVYGYGNSNDTLVAGLGDKYLAGEGGADTYVYTSAGSSDIVDDGGSSSNLVMQDIASIDVTLSRPNGNNDLVMTDTLTGKTVTAWGGEFSPWGLRRVLQAITFANGVVWHSAQVRQMLLDQESAAVGGAVYGYGNSNDTLVAGLGDKYLAGEGGADAYIYTSAGGNDVVDDGGSSSNLVMQDIASTDISVSRPNGNNDLGLTDGLTGKTVTVRGEFSPWGSGVLQAITFAGRRGAGARRRCARCCSIRRARRSAAPSTATATAMTRWWRASATNISPAKAGPTPTSTHRPAATTSSTMAARHRTW